MGVTVTRRSVSRGGFRRVVACGALVSALAAGAATAGGETVASAPPSLASFTARAMGGDEQISLAWRYARIDPVGGKLHLDLFHVVNGAPVKVGANIIGNTIEPDSYAIPVPPGQWMVRATPEDNEGFGAGINSPVVNIRNPCLTASVCTRITTSHGLGHVRLAGEGFLHGATNGAGQLTNAARVSALKPRQWRFAGPSVDAAVSALAVSRTEVLSDLWSNATAPSNNGDALTPWSDWQRWRDFVTTTVTTAERQGWAPDYWDVWNEPNGLCCPRFSAADLDTVTVANWLQTYAIAWQAVKAVDPSARVVGPSLSALQWAPGSPHEFDLDTFLANAADHGITWDAISWHENTTRPSPGDFASSVTNVDRHVAMARAVMARHPGTVAGNRILINEYGPSETHALAGWAVGYFRAFEDDHVSQANLACWTAAECTTSLDGLLTADGRPTATWWAHKLYADLTNGARMRVASTSTWQVDGLATRDDSTHTLRVLLGRHSSCNSSANAWCTDPTRVAAASVTVTIAWPYGTAPARVTISRLAAGTGALSAPTVLRVTTLRPRSGVLTMTVTNVADGDALSVIARRS